MTNDKITSDEKKQLKRDRIRDYFLNAAKEIILEDGVESITVRSVADKAGYSYATLYNYFEDLNSLLWHTKYSLINDVFAWMKEAVTGLPENISGLKKTYEVYMSYYFEHPSVFNFFYNHKVSPPQSIAEATELDFDKAMRETFKGLVLACKLREEDVPVAYRLLVYVVHGLLMLHFSGNADSTPEMAVGEMSMMIDFIFNRKVNET
jgi:AcrR family transcriptional regulator